MPTYTVQCDTCNSTFDARSYNITDFVKGCDFCGGDICSKCEDEEYHAECKKPATDESEGD